MTRRLGIFGGTFNPPHVGHVIAALNVKNALVLDMVTLMVAGEPWQKASGGNVESPGDRLAMTHAAVDGIAGLDVGDDEVLRGGPTYTVDTLEKISQQQPDTELFTIIGADAALGLKTWHRWEEITSLSTLVIVNRDAMVLDDVNNFDAQCVVIADIEASSSEVRRRISQGQSVDHLVVPSVLEIIKQRNLYQEADEAMDN